MFDNSPNFFGVILNTVLSEIDDGESSWVFEVVRFQQVENLNPVSPLQRVFMQIFCEVNDDWSFLNLDADDSSDWLRFVGDCLAFFWLTCEKPVHFSNCFCYIAQIEA